MCYLCWVERIHCTPCIPLPHEPEFALKSNTFAFIFFCLANGERNTGCLDLNEMWCLSSCSSNSEEPENELIAFKQVLLCYNQQILGRTQNLHQDQSLKL